MQFYSICIYGLILSLLGAFPPAFAAKSTHKSTAKVATKKTSPPAPKVDPQTAARQRILACEKALAEPIEKLLKPMAPSDVEADERAKEIDNTNRQIESLKAAGSNPVTQSYIKNNWLFTRMLDQIVSGVSANEIANQLVPYVQPAVNRSLEILAEAKKANDYLAEGSDSRSPGFKKIVGRYEALSDAFGPESEQARMIVWALESMRAGKGVLYLTSMPHLDTSDPIVAQGSKLVVYRLTSPQVQNRADQILSFLDRNLIVSKGFVPQAVAQLRTDQGDLIPYPTLYLTLNTVFANNSAARLSQLKADLKEQEALNSTRFWLAQTGLEWMAAVYSNPTVPTFFRKLTQLLAAPLDSYVKSQLYDAKIYDLKTSTEMVDQNGDIVISGSTYLVDLQIDKLDQLLAQVGQDQGRLLEALVQNVGSRRVMDILLNALAQRAGVSSNQESGSEKSSNAPVVVLNGVSQASAQILYQKLADAVTRVKSLNLLRIPWNRQSGLDATVSTLLRHAVGLGITSVPITAIVAIVNHWQFLMHSVF